MRNMACVIYFSPKVIIDSYVDYLGRCFKCLMLFKTTSILCVSQQRMTLYSSASCI